MTDLRRHPGGGKERGSGSVMAVGLVGVLATLLVAGLLVAAVATTGQRARTAADLSALAVAGASTQGAAPAEACATGARVAERHGAEVVSCALAPTTGGLPRAEVEVTASVDGTPWQARARAAAGAVPTRTGRVAQDPSRSGTGWERGTGSYRSGSSRLRSGDDGGVP